MIQSYLFDPVQVPAPGYINEVNSCKLDEGDNAKFKGRRSSQALVPKGEHPSEGVKRTSSRSTAADRGEAHGADRTWGSSNGLGPAPAPQPADADGPQNDRVSWASTENGAHPSQPFLEGPDADGQDGGSPAREANPRILNGDSSAAAGAERGLQLPPPDYPEAEPAAAGGAENARLQPPVHPESAEPPEDPRAVRLQALWDSFGEALSTDGLSLCWKDGDPAPPAAPLVHWGNGWAAARGDPGAPEVDEDAAVAEALAALEAATAGEDVDEAE